MSNGENKPWPQRSIAGMMLGGNEWVRQVEKALKALEAESEGASSFTDWCNGDPENGVPAKMVPGGLPGDDAKSPPFD